MYIFVTILIITVVLTLLIGIPYCGYSYWYHNLSQQYQYHFHSAVQYKWAFCIVALLLSICILVFLISNVNLHNNEAGDKYDVKHYYYIALVSLLSFPLIDFLSSLIVAALMYKCGKFCLKREHISQFLTTSVLITILTYLLQQLTLCGYFILLAAIASPFYTLPLLLLYISFIVSIILLLTMLLKLFHTQKKSKFFHTKKKSKIFLIITLIIFSVSLIFSALLYVFRQLVILFGTNNTDDGIVSIIGSLIPTMLLSTISFIIKKFINILGVSNKLNGVSKNPPINVIW